MGNDPIQQGGHFARPRKRTGHLRRASTSRLCKRGIAYGTRVLWRRSLRSSPRPEGYRSPQHSWEAGHMAKGGRCFRDPTEEVREMRNAETVLGIIRERGSRGLPLE